MLRVARVYIKWAPLLAISGGGTGKLFHLLQGSSLPLLSLLLLSSRQDKLQVLSGGDFLIRWSPLRSTMLQVAPASPWVGAEPAALGFVLALANEEANGECPYFWGWNATWLRIPLHGSTWVICSKPVRCAISQYIQWVVSKKIYIYTWIFERLIYFDPFGCLPIIVGAA